MAKCILKCETVARGVWEMSLSPKRGQTDDRLMNDYDFLILSASEFERLTRDLLQKHLGCHIESFTQGRDGGVDLRYAGIKGKHAIIQCKRYKDYPSLKRELAREVEKVKTLSPCRYYISTTVGLTPANKDEIKQMFTPFIQGTEDILGRDDLNNLLAQHSDIEKQYYKLWLCSTAVLERIVNRRVLNWSKLEYQACLDESRKYVMNESFDQAMDKLLKYHYVIISGIPGIGKTTLARQLIFHKLATDYDDFICITGDFDNAMDMLEEERKQIFFFDDFLGNTFFEHGEKGYESKLLSFIRLIRGRKDKLLVLTTREYILQDAMMYYEKMGTHNIELSKCVVDLGSYTKMIKAEILYNHLSYSEVPVDCLRYLVKQDYFYLINHKNYNPRVIEAFINHEEWQGKTPKEFYDTFCYVFDHPNSVWQMAFSRLDSVSQYALLVLVTLHRPCLIEDWREAFGAFADVTKDVYGLSMDDSLWNKSLKTLDGSFLKTERWGDNHMVVNLFNPSIADFLVDHISGRPELIRYLIKGSVFVEQLYEQYSSISKHNKIFVHDDILKDLADMLSLMLNHVSKEVRTCTIYLMSRNELVCKPFVVVDCLKTIYDNLPALRDVNLLNVNEIVLDEFDFLSYSSSLEDRLDVMEIVAEQIDGFDAQSLYHKMGKSIVFSSEYVTYLEYGAEHDYDISSVVNDDYLREIEQSIHSELESCSRESEVEELQSTISDLSNLLPYWDSSEVLDYAETQIEKLREEESEDESYSRSDFYKEVVKENKNIREMFESLVG